jgi:hypothetical protein
MTIGDGRHSNGFQFRHWSAVYFGGADPWHAGNREPPRNFFPALAHPIPPNPLETLGGREKPQSHYFVKIDKSVPSVSGQSSKHTRWFDRSGAIQFTLNQCGLPGIIWV